MAIGKVKQVAVMPETEGHYAILVALTEDGRIFSLKLRDSNEELKKATSWFEHSTPGEDAKDSE